MTLTKKEIIFKYINLDTKPMKRFYMLRTTGNDTIVYDIENTDVNPIDSWDPYKDTPTAEAMFEHFTIEIVPVVDNFKKGNGAYILQQDPVTFNDQVCYEWKYYGVDNPNAVTLYSLYENGTENPPIIAAYGSNGEQDIPTGIQYGVHLDFTNECAALQELADNTSIESEKNMLVKQIGILKKYTAKQTTYWLDRFIIDGDAVVDNKFVPQNTVSTRLYADTYTNIYKRYITELIRIIIADGGGIETIRQLVPKYCVAKTGDFIVENGMKYEVTGVTFSSTGSTDVPLIDLTTELPQIVAKIVQDESTLAFRKYLKQLKTTNFGTGEEKVYIRYYEIVTAIQFRLYDQDENLFAKLDDECHGGGGGDNTYEVQNTTLAIQSHDHSVSVEGNRINIMDDDISVRDTTMYI